nr:hypothetical protein [Tanacetum cinerariifolium]
MVRQHDTSLSWTRATYYELCSALWEDRAFGEIVTHWFTLIVLSALRRSDNENMLSLVILIPRIGKSNFRLRSDLKSKASTLQVVYDVLKLTPFYKAFFVTADVPKNYIETLQICPRIPNQPFDELPFEEEILAFLREHGHSYDSLRLSQAQILWGMYHKKNVDFAYLPWEDFVYQVEHKDAKKRNEMYYPRFTKVIVNFFMTKDQSIPRRNKVNWHFARDDHMFTTIKLVSRHHNTQQYGAILPVELMNEAIKNSESYKGYYAIASGAEPPKIKSSIRKKQSSSDTTVPPPTTKAKRLKTSAKVDKPAKEKQPAKLSKAKGVLDVPTYESDDEEISWKSSEDDDDELKISKHDDDVDDQSDDDQDDQDDEQTNLDDDDDDFIHPKFSTHDEEDKDEESFNPIGQTPSQVENTDDEDNDEDSHGMNVEGNEGANEEDNGNELYGDVKINLEGRDIQMADVQTTQVIEDTYVTLTLVNPEGQQYSSSMSSRFVLNMLNLSSDTGIDCIFESTPRVDVLVTTTAEPPLLSTTTLPPLFIHIISLVQQTPAPAPSPANVPSSSLQYLSNFSSLFGFDHRLETLKTNFSKLMQTNQFAEVISSIFGIVDKYLDHRMNKAMKKIIKEQVKEQVKVQVSKILSKIKKTVNEQLEAEILIDKMESNKLIHISDEQKNLYKALVDAYECDKLILDTYRDTVTLKRLRDDKDKDEEPSAGSNWGSNRRQAGKEVESTIAPKGKTSKTSGKSTEGYKSHHKTASESAPAEEPMHTTQDLEELNKTLSATYGRIQPWISNLAKKADSRTSFNKLTDTHVDFSAFMMKRLKVDTLTPKLLVGPIYKLIKGSCKSLVELEFFLEEPLPLIPNSRGRRVIPFDHFFNNDLEYLHGGVSSRKYTTSITKTKATDCEHIKWIEDLGRKRQQFYGFAVNTESARDVYFKRRIIAVTELQIVEWHNYKHLDWITVRRDDDKLYKFKEGDFKRLCIQDIKDMLLLPVQGNLTNLMVDERFTFNVSLQMFTRSIVIQRCVEDL